MRNSIICRTSGYLAPAQALLVAATLLVAGCGASGSPPTGPSESANKVCRLAETWTSDPAGKQNCEVYSYDAAGNQVRLAQDFDCDGIADACSDAVWNADGQRVSSVRDLACDGSADHLCIAWTYASSTAYTKTEDYDCDGVADLTTDLHVDGLGRVLEEDIAYGQEAEGSSACYKYAYDVDGNRTERRLDEYCDGITDWCETEEFAGPDLPVAYQMDLACDGVPDRNCRTTVRTSLASGGTRSTQKLDADCDGTDVTCWSTDTNLSGDTIRREVDEHCDGVAERCEDFQFDEAHSITTHTIREPCDAPPRTCADAVARDEAQLIISTQDDPTCSGAPENCTTYAYDETGRLAAVTVDAECDGHYVTCVRYDYDADGNETERRTENPCGSAAPTIQHWEHTCGTTQ